MCCCGFHISSYQVFDEWARYSRTAHLIVSNHRARGVMVSTRNIPTEFCRVGSRIGIEFIGCLYRFCAGYMLNFKLSNLTSVSYCAVCHITALFEPYQICKPCGKGLNKYARYHSFIGITSFRVNE